MASNSAPRNRKERRAAAKEGRAADSIPMARPDRTQPKGKTLFEIAAEREAALRGRSEPAFSAASGENGEPSVVTINPDGTLSGPDGEPLSAELSAQIKASMDPEAKRAASEKARTDEEEGAALAESILYTVTLCILHFTFSIVVAHQYGMNNEMPWLDTAWSTAKMVPILLIIVYTLHPRAGTWWAQLLFFAMSVATGCWLIWASTNAPYMAVMRRAPGAGAVWIWAALESRVEVAIAGAAAVGAYYWYGGYSIF